MAALWAALGTAVAGLLLVIVQAIQRRQARADGRKLAAGEVAVIAAKAEAAVAQAEAEAPRTKAGVIDVLKRGEF